MRSFFFAGILALAVGGCGARRAAPPVAPHASEPANTAAVRVFVETMLVELPSSRLNSLDSRTFAQIAMDTSVTVLTSPQVLVGDHQRVRLSLDDELNRWRWELSADVMKDARVRIGIDLTRTAGQSVRTTMVVDSGQTVIAPTTLAAGEGMTVVLLMRAEVVRGKEDLKTIFERKMRERQAAPG